MLDELRILDAVSKCIKKLPAIMATEGVNFSKERFVNQNWIDNTTEPWKKRKTSRKTAGRNRGAILVDSGRLKRSIRKIKVTTDGAVIGTDVPYAQAHNDGYRGRKQVKQHMSRSRKGTNFQVKAHTANTNLPRRRFIGESSALSKRIERTCTAEIMRAIKSAI